MKTNKKEFFDEDVSFGIELPASLRNAIERAALDHGMKKKEAYKSACIEWLKKIGAGWEPTIDPDANVVAPKETELVQRIADIFADPRNEDGNALKRLLPRIVRAK